MKHLIICIMAVFTTCCGHKMQVSIDPEFQAYVDQWHADAAKTTGHDVPIADLIMTFGTQLESPGAQGICIQEFNKTPVIQILNDWWVNNTDPLQRQTILYHELGHCILGREHDNTMIGVSLPLNGTMQTIAVPESIMYYMTGQIYDIYWNGYEPQILQEYFSKGYVPEWEQ